MDRNLLRGNIPTFVLSLLKEGPMYGYQISGALRERTGGTLTLAYGTLYNTLKDLEEAALIRSYWVTQPNGRERHYYELLPEGLEALEARLMEWDSLLRITEAIFPARGR